MKILESYDVTTEKPEFIIVFDSAREKEKFLSMTDGANEGIIKFKLSELYFHGPNQSHRNPVAVIGAPEK